MAYVRRRSKCMPRGAAVVQRGGILPFLAIPAALAAKAVAIAIAKKLAQKAAKKAVKGAHQVGYY